MKLNGDFGIFARTEFQIQRFRNNGFRNKLLYRAFPFFRENFSLSRLTFGQQNSQLAPILDPL